MSKHYTLTANKRDRAGKGVARALRRENRIPAVIYGEGKPPVLISCLEKDVSLQFLKGGMRIHICDMDVEGDKVSVLARDIQLHPVSDRVEHVDFMRIGPQTKLNVKVPLHFVNHDASPAIKAKGVMNIVHHHLDLRCFVTDIPESITIDLTGAEMTHVFKLSDVTLPKGAEPVGYKTADETLAIIAEPLVREEVVAPVAAPAKGAKGKKK